MSTLRYAARQAAALPVNAFGSAEEAWFWFVRCQQVRREGAHLAGGGSFSRPCDPDDIYRAVVGLRRRGVLRNTHLTVLATFGLIGRRRMRAAPTKRRQRACGMKRWTDCPQSCGTRGSSIDERNPGVHEWAIGGNTSG